MASLYVPVNQASPEALPGVRQTTIADVNDFGGAAAAQESRTGLALANAGADVTRAGAVMQERENADLVFRAETAVRDKQLQFDQSLDERRGQNAWGATTDATKFWDDATKDAQETLTNDRQRQVFQQSIGRLRNAHLEKVSNYEAVQRRASLEDSAKASIATAINAAAAGANEWAARPNVRDLQVDPNSEDRSTWDKRTDGSDKGTGYLGLLKRPDGNVSSEISVGVQINGKEMDIPLLVPTLTRSEVDTVLGAPIDGKYPPEILQKAADFASQRIAQGKPVFATPEDQRPTDAVSMAKDEIIKRELVLGKINGWTPERQQYELQKDLTDLHKQVIQARIVNDPKGAQAYYEFNKQEINGADRDGIERVLNEGNTRLTAQQIGDKVTSEGMDEGAALAYARAHLDGKDEEAAVTEIHTRYAEKATIQATADKQVSDAAWRVIAKGGGRAQIPAATWAALDGKEQEQINEHLRVRAQQAQALAEGKPQKTDITAYYDIRKMAVNDPAAFGSMNLLTLPQFSKLSPQDQQEVVNLQASAHKQDDKFKEVQSADRQISQSVASLGMTDKQEVALAERKIGEAIDNEGRLRGKPLDAESRQKVIDQMFIKGEVLSGHWYTPDPNRSVYQVVGTPDAKNFAPKIPDDERPKIEAAIRADGKPVTEAEVLRRYKRKVGL